VLHRFVHLLVHLATDTDLELLALFSAGGLVGTFVLMHLLPVTAEMAVISASAL
jgi:hypothetical protein